MYHTNKLLSLLNYNLAATKKVIHFLSCVQPDKIRGSEANVRTYMFYVRICLYPPKAKAKGHNLKVRIARMQFYRKIKWVPVQFGKNERSECNLLNEFNFFRIGQDPI